MEHRKIQLIGGSGQIRNDAERREIQLAGGSWQEAAGRGQKTENKMQLAGGRFKATGRHGDTARRSGDSKSIRKLENWIIRELVYQKSV